MSAYPHHVLPFDIPEYLATYFGNKLCLNPKMRTNGSYNTPFHVDGYSPSGLLVLQQLTTTHSKPVPNPATKYYISVSSRTEENEKANRLDGRSTFLGFSENGLKTIEEKFKQTFEMQLMSYISGAEFVYASSAENKRIRTRAIRQFCEENNVLYSEQNMGAWQKRHQRQKNSRKSLIYTFL